MNPIPGVSLADCYQQALREYKTDLSIIKIEKPRASAQIKRRRAADDEIQKLYDELSKLPVNVPYAWDQFT
jgi:hypothetical protein